MLKLISNKTYHLLTKKLVVFIKLKLVQRSKNNTLFIWLKNIIYKIICKVQKQFFIDVFPLTESFLDIFFKHIF